MDTITKNDLVTMFSLLKDNKENSELPNGVQIKESKFGFTLFYHGQEITDLESYRVITYSNNTFVVEICSSGAWLGQHDFYLLTEDDVIHVGYVDQDGNGYSNQHTVNKVLK